MKCSINGRCLRKLAVVLGVALRSFISSEANPVRILIPGEARNDEGLKRAAEDLKRLIVDSSIVFREPSVSLPEGDLLLLGRPPEVASVQLAPMKSEAFRIRPGGIVGRRSVVVEGDERGVMCGAFRLAERIRLGADPFAVAMECSPDFPMRMFSEEGQLLDLPDRNYYAEDVPFVDLDRMDKEIEEAKRLVDHVARLGFNAITFLHVNCEDYIDYRYLDEPIYAEDDRHLVRSPVFCRYMTDLCDYAHARHLDVFLQLYEIQYPPKVDELYGIDLESPHIERIISAKCKELFERVPLDGLVITPTESHPRCGYRSKHLWAKEGRGRRGAGRMLTLYHEACQAVGKKAIFRLWRIAGSAEGVRSACQSIPEKAMISVKNTGGDFWINSPLTDIVTAGVGQEQPLMVVFDAFRQYDGWSRTFCYMKQWGERIRLCRDNGVLAVNVWGAWSPGCIWPDFEPGYMKNPDGTDQTGPPVAWAGHWSAFRMLTQGFTPGQSNVYLLSHLSWDADADPKQIAKEFASIHLGAENAGAGTEALMQTQDAWRELYPGSSPGAVAHPVYMKWTMVFGPREDLIQAAYDRFSLQEMMASNSRAMQYVDAMESAFARIDRSKAPDPLMYERFAQGIDKTVLTLRSLLLFREFWWRNRADLDLEGRDKASNAERREDLRSKLAKLCDDWAKYPEEAGAWRMTTRYGEPCVYSKNAFPYWWPRGGDSTLEGILNTLR